MIALFIDNGIFICCINALCIKFCSQSILRTKTDKIDSAHITQYELTYEEKLNPVRPIDLQGTYVTCSLILSNCFNTKAKVIYLPKLC